MALQDLTILTLLFEFLPPLIVTFVYLLFFRKRQSKLIEVFIGVMYLKSLTWFLFTIALDTSVVTYSNPTVDTVGLVWALFTDMIFQFAFSLQDFLTWILIAFYAVLFGMVVLAVKLLLQDPAKMFFKNYIRRITKKEPESDGFANFRDRVNNVRFTGVEPQPLDPEVQSRAWRDAWKDYLIIGLATLIPSIGVYMGSLGAFIDNAYHGTTPVVNNYLLAITILLTWIYRFGYPASNRIAKGAGLYLGEKDIGSEMMRGVLGWFFRLNILISLYFIITQVWTFLSSSIPDVAIYVAWYYIYGLLYAAPPIIFAILILPIAEDFAVVFYKKLFEAIAFAKRKMGRINIRQSLENLVAGIGTGVIVSLAVIGAIIAATLNYTLGAYLFPPQLGDSVRYIITGASNNYAIYSPVIWTLLMLGIPFAFMLFIGIFGHMVRKNIGRGGIETFAFLSGSTVALLTYLEFIRVDYILAAFTLSSNYAGFTFNRIIPVPIVPGEELWLWRLASEFVINLPMFVFTALFVLYFFDFRAKWKVSTGDVEGPLLNTHKRDILDSVLMFFGGLAVSLVGVWLVSAVLANPAIVKNTLEFLLAKIGNPDGLEALLVPGAISGGGLFILIAEHNIVRTLLMLIIGPVFWSAVLWFTGVKKEGNTKLVGTWSIVLLVVCSGLTYIWTVIDIKNLVFYNLPTDLATQLGFRAVFALGIPVLLILLYAGLNSVRGKGIGVSWFPLFILMFGIEYFVYDDQFTLLSLIVVPFLLAGAYRIFLRNRLSNKKDSSSQLTENADVSPPRKEDFLITYIKFSLMSLAITEVLSTALTIGGIAIIRLTAPPPAGGNVAWFLASILPHAIVEIPVFLIAAAASIRIAKDLWPTVEAEDWESIPTRTRALLGDERTWRTFALIAFMLIIAALIEAFVTYHIANMFLA